jgi:hypothetical protein
MSRSIWAAALGVSVFALAATLSASPGEPVQPASIHAEQASYPVPIVHHIVPVQTPALRHPHANAVRPRGHSAARALTQPHIVRLAPGSGFQQAAGSGPVRVLQRRLTGLGFAPGPIDGRYGPLTTHAVERFQTARRLTVNGVADAGTLRVLFTIRRRPPVTVSSQPRPSSQPHSAVPAHSTTPVEAAPVSGEHSPALPVVPVLLALAALGIAVMLLRSGRTRSRERRELALHEQMPRGFASGLADVRDVDSGTGGYQR